MEATQIGATKLASNETFFLNKWDGKLFQQVKNKTNIQIGQDTSAPFPECLLIMNMHIFSKTKTAQ